MGSGSGGSVGPVIDPETGEEIDDDGSSSFGSEETNSVGTDDGGR